MSVSSPVLPTSVNGSPPQPASPSARHVALTVALAVIGIFVTYLPITAVSVTLTRIQEATGAATSDLQWVSDALVIPMAAIVLSAGVIGDIFGRRKVFVTGMAFTVTGAVLSGLASTLPGMDALHLLWAGQAIAGIGGGLLLSTTLALIAHAVPDPRRRGPFVGLWSTGLTAGLALGPLMSGGILELASWGWIFLPVAVLAAITGVVAAFRLPESKSPAGRKLDWPGQILAAITIVGVIYGVIEGGRDGWTSVQSLTGLILGGLALVAFIIVELRSDAPLVHLELFRIPTFAASAAAALIALFAIVGSMFLFSIFLGGTQHLSPIEIGWRLLFSTGVAAVVSPAVGYLMKYVAPIFLVAAGLLLSALAMFLLTGVGSSTGFFDIGWRLAVFGIADALMLSAVSVAALNAVPHRLAGMSVAANTAMRQLGGALGPAILGVVFASRLESGGTTSEAFHAALVVTGVLLAVSGIACLATPLLPRPKQLSKE